MNVEVEMDVDIDSYVDSFVDDETTAAYDTSTVDELSSAADVTSVSYAAFMSANCLMLLVGLCLY